MNRPSLPLHPSSVDIQKVVKSRWKTRRMQGCKDAGAYPPRPQLARRSYHEAIIQLTFEPSSHQDFIMTTLERYRGCLLGLATGDALGTTLEFKWPGNFKPL